MTSNTEEILIRCDVRQEGIFPSEITVLVHGLEGDVAFPADRSLIHDRGLEHYILATRYSVDATGAIICVLPSEVTDNGSRWVRVKPQDCVSAA